MAEQYLTVPEVAELLQLSEKTVYRLAQRAELPAFKVGSAWRFRRRDIDAWAHEQVRNVGGRRARPMTQTRTPELPDGKRAS